MKENKGRIKIEKENSFDLVFKYLLSFFVILFLSLVILQFNIFDESYYIKQFEKYDTYRNFENDSILFNKNHEVLEFLKGNSRLDANFFSVKEINHMNDVRNIFFEIRVCMFVLLSFIFAFSAYLAYRKKHFLNELFFVSAIVLSLLSISILALLIDFQSLFILFHKLLFSNNDWLLSSDDNLIIMYSSQFFMNFAIRIFMQIFIMLVAILIISRQWMKINP